MAISQSPMPLSPPAKSNPVERTTRSNARGIYGNDDPKPDLSIPQFGLAHAGTTFSLTRPRTDARPSTSAIPRNPNKVEFLEPQHDNIPSTSTHSSAPWRHVVSGSRRDLGSSGGTSVDGMGPSSSILMHSSSSMLCLSPHYPDRSRSSSHSNPKLASHLDPPALTYDRYRTQTYNHDHSHSLVRVEPTMIEDRTRLSHRPTHVYETVEMPLVNRRHPHEHHHHKDHDRHRSGAGTGRDDRTRNFHAGQGRPEDTSSTNRVATRSHARETPSNSNPQSTSLIQSFTSGPYDNDDSARNNDVNGVSAFGVPSGNDQSPDRRTHGTRRLSRPRSRGLGDRRPRSRDQLR